MADKLLECVPNFSEGKDPQILEALKQSIEAVPDVQLLNMDSGEAAHRTVFTFAGKPEAVVEAAFHAIKQASASIDMALHQGEHPRMGATDVCPLIPLRGMSMEEADAHARELAQRVGDELGIPVYLYEQSATKPERENLANVRKGGYESMENKLRHPEWIPDAGPTDLPRKAGVTAIGARDFLIAFNMNLNTKKTKKAHQVACDIRESGRPKRDKKGNPVKDKKGQTQRIPGALKKVKGIGWYIEEFGQAQISMNLTDLQVSPLHRVFETVIDNSAARGLRVTGSEIVGMVPERVLLETGKHFLEKQGEDRDSYEKEDVVDMAVLSLELNDVVPFNPEEKVIEYQLSL